MSLGRLRGNPTPFYLRLHPRDPASRLHPSGPAPAARSVLWPHAHDLAPPLHRGHARSRDTPHFLSPRPLTQPPRSVPTPARRPRPSSPSRLPPAPPSGPTPTSRLFAPGFRRRVRFPWLRLRAWALGLAGRAAARWRSGRGWRPENFGPLKAGVPGEETDIRPLRSWCWWLVTDGGWVAGLQRCASARELQAHPGCEADRS